MNRTAAQAAARAAYETERRRLVAEFEALPAAKRTDEAQAAVERAVREARDRLVTRGHGAALLAARDDEQPAPELTPAAAAWAAHMAELEAAARPHRARDRTSEVHNRLVRLLRDPAARAAHLAAKRADERRRRVLNEPQRLDRLAAAARARLDAQLAALATRRVAAEARALRLLADEAAARDREAAELAARADSSRND